jgi:hypothetical protein
MSEYLADPIFLGFMLLISSAIAAVALVMLYVSPRQKKLEESVVATSEWQPTGKIDFHCAETPQDDKVPAAFLLRVEDYRTVESISGVEHMEIRWRNATLAEAKSVVIAHQSATDSAAKGYQIPRLVRAPAIADSGPADDRTVIPATSAFGGGAR